MRAIRLLLEKGVASGEFRESPARDFPQIIAAPAVLAVVWTLIFGSHSSLDFEAYRNAHVQFVSAGLRGAETLPPHHPGGTEVPGERPLNGLLGSASS